MSAPPRRHGRAPEAPDTCLVPGCGGVAIRHLALAEARRAFPSLPDKGRRVPLCRDHYKQWKKETKESRTLSRLGW